MINGETTSSKISSEPHNPEDPSTASSNGESTLSSIFTHALKNPSQLHLPLIDSLHGGSTSTETSSDSFNFQIDFDVSSFEDHVLVTSEDLNIVNSEDFEEETSIFVPEETAPSAILGGSSRKCLWDSSLETMFSNLHEDLNEKLQRFDFESSNPSLHPSSLVETSVETLDSNSVETSSISEMISRLEKEFTSQLNSFKTLCFSCRSSSSSSESSSDFDSLMIESPSLCEKESPLELYKIPSFVLVPNSYVSSDLSSCLKVPS